MKLSFKELRSLYKDSPVVGNFYDNVVEEYVTNKTVLDVGCANYVDDRSFGINHTKIIDVCSQCVAIDISDDIEKLPKRDNVEYIKADAEQFVMDRNFDVIMLGDVIEHLSNPGLFFGCARQMMDENSSLLILTPNPFGFRFRIGVMNRFEPRIMDEHTTFYSVQTVNELISRYGLKIKKIFYIRGQEFHPNDSFLYRSYKFLYRALAGIPYFKRYLDTLAFEIVIDK